MRRVSSSAANTRTISKPRKAGKAAEWWALLASALVVAGLLWLLVGDMGLMAAVHPAAVASDPVIAAAGEIACDPGAANFNGGAGTATGCRQKYTSDLLVNAGYAAVLPLGDNQYFCGSLTAFEQSYDLSWGRLKSITHPAPGNHEYMTSGGTGCDNTNAAAAGYFAYFGSAAGVPGSGYYSYDIGSWHLIVLNTQCSSVGGCGSKSPEYIWLQNDLATHTNFCTLAYWHIPLFSSGSRANPASSPFWSLLYNYNADVVLNGHDHIYERFAPQDPSGTADPMRGIRQFTVGTGGDDHTTITAVAANSEVQNTDTFGILRLTLHATSYDWQFVPEAGKSFTDSGTGNCHDASGQAPTPTATAVVTPSSTPTTPPTATVPPTSSAGGGQSVMFVPQADAYVNSANSSANYGAATALRADGSPDVHSYLSFAVSGLNGATIRGARLMLYMNSGSSAKLDAAAVADSSWDESAITYENMPALGSTIGTSGVVVGGTWVAIDVTGYVTGEGLYSFGILTPGSTAVSFASRESGANAPQLILDVGP